MWLGASERNVVQEGGARCHGSSAAHLTRAREPQQLSRLVRLIRGRASTCESVCNVNNVTVHHQGGVISIKNLTAHSKVVLLCGC